MDITSSLTHLKTQITQLEKKYARKPGSVNLLAVSKNQSLEKIISAYEAGQRKFGENYLQEAEEKIKQLKDKNIEWHFIGNIQSNKTRKIAELFSWVQSINSVKQAQRLSEQRPPHLEPLNICLEVNLDAEASKSGALPDEINLLAKACTELPMLTLRGLMAIPHKTSSFEEQRQAFHALKKLYAHLCNQGYQLDTLSMGMSGDFEAAIAEGSTMVRIGTALFGERD